ncbi:MAG: bifunctional nuclease family protein, partial [Halobacteriota archaeon]|nr:bifunctional nuclease family protein [Halobacteriota archaeon]
MGEVSVKIDGVYMVGTRMQPVPVVLLSDEQGNSVPIYIGVAEAISIKSALINEITPRPMTHDLMISLINCLDGTVARILIDDLDEGVYYARLFIKKDGSQKELDARPSDCIALALRSDAEILVSESVFEKASLDKEELKKLKDESL